MHTNLDIMSYNYTNIVTDQTCNLQYSKKLYISTLKLNVLEH